MRGRIQYSKEGGFRRWGAYIFAAGLLGLAGWFMYGQPPGTWWIEAVVLGLIWLGLFIIGAWWRRRLKWGWTLAGGIVSLLVLSRTGLLNWWTFGFWLITVGLISLIN